MLGKVDYLSTHASRQLHGSFLQTGFAVLVNHPVSKDLIANTYADWQRFFALPSRFNYLFDQASQTGYRPAALSEKAKGYNHIDLKEFFNYYEGGVCPPHALENTRRLRAELLKVAHALLAWVEQEMPPAVQQKLSEPLSQMVAGSTKHLFRPMHYPAFTGAEVEGALRAAPHEDINFITLLPASTAPGLQVKDIEGVWHELDCDPGALIVNIAEMLDIATGGYYPATTHQVVNPQGPLASKPRFSMPFFMHARPEVYLTPQRTVGDLLQERLIELGLA
ncbi:MAG: 2OG-Fe(II) oxygenase family protein [Myxococcota bacterium]